LIDEQEKRLGAMGIGVIIGVVLMAVILLWLRYS
jgi:hypothetical protein